MKTKLNILTVVVFAFCAGFQAKPQGYLVPNGVTADQALGGSGARVRQGPSNPADYTGFYFINQGGSSFQFFTLLDEGVRVFFLEGNDPITAQAIQANSYTELTYPNTYQIPNGADFYVGLYTGYNPWIIVNGSLVYTGIYIDPVFGWAELFNNNGTIQLLDSALAFESQGIYAGTTTLIPEPTTLSLFGLGALLLGWNWHRRNSR